jgi:hypothetical protein
VLKWDLFITMRRIDRRTSRIDRRTTVPAGAPAHTAHRGPRKSLEKV